MGLNHEFSKNLYILNKSAGILTESPCVFMVSERVLRLPESEKVLYVLVSLSLSSDWISLPSLGESEQVLKKSKSLKNLNNYQENLKRV